MKGLEKVVETRWGPVPIRGLWSGKPLVVVISGAFDNWRSFRHMVAALPTADVALVSLPGFDAPELLETSLEAFTLAIGEGIALAFPGRQYVAAGVSLGALVALGLSARRIVASEPFASIAGQAEFIRWAQSRVGIHPGLDRFLINVFGITRDGVEPRDFTSVLMGSSVPTLILAGEAGFLDAGSVEMLAAKSDTTVRTLPGVGHDVLGGAPGVFERAVAQMCEDARPELMGGNRGR